MGLLNGKKQARWLDAVSNLQNKVRYVCSIAYLALKEIWENDDHTRDYYYSFPQRWEENGLAKLIRERVGVPYTARYEDPGYWDDLYNDMAEKYGNVDDGVKE